VDKKPRRGRRKNSFPWSKIQLEKECAVSHSNFLIEALKRENKR
jgi:hypothetical protein